MTTLQKATIAATLAVVAGGGIHQAYKASQLRDQVQMLQQQQTPLAEQIQQLQRERDDATNRLAMLQQASEQMRRDTPGLARVREVARLQADERELAQLRAAETQRNSDPMESAAKALQGKMKLLKQRLEQMPDKNIPELQYLSNENMAHIALDARLDTDAGVREALFWVRNAAKQFFTRQMWQALRKYVQSSNGQLPTDVSQLKPYFEVPVHDTTLARYRMIRTGNAGDLQPDEMIVAEKAAVDDEYDELFQIGLYGQRFQGVGKKTGENGASSWP
jgi:myosin heavy subunit